jgi:hypothetical protein
MKNHLSELNMSLSDLPLVVQFNKRDLPNAMLTSSLQNLLYINGSPTFEAVAVQGQGVFDTLKAIINKVVSKVQREMV